MLGLAALPFSGVVAQDFGLLIDYRSTHPSLALDAGGLGTQYALNRTMAHEVAHCFGVLHTFTDPDSALPSDRRAEPGDDPLGDGAVLTPPQEVPTLGDPLNAWGAATGTRNEAGAPVALANVLNYVDDAAMLALTADQAARMEFFHKTRVGPEGTGAVLVSDARDTGEQSWLALPPPAAAELVPVNGTGDETGDDNGGSGLAGWAIALIVIGVLLLIVIIVLLCLYLPGSGQDTPNRMNSGRASRDWEF